MGQILGLGVIDHSVAQFDQDVGAKGTQRSSRGVVRRLCAFERHCRIWALSRRCSSSIEEEAVVFVEMRQQIVKHLTERQTATAFVRSIRHCCRNGRMRVFRPGTAATACKFMRTAATACKFIYFRSRHYGVVGG